MNKIHEVKKAATYIYSCWVYDSFDGPSNWMTRESSRWDVSPDIIYRLLNIGVRLINRKRVYNED